MRVINYLFVLLLMWSCKENIKSENIVKEDIHSVNFIDEIGVERNELRKKDSLPIIPSNWIVIELKQNEVSWGISEDVRNHKGHVMKTVRFDSSKVVIEELDLYFSGNKIKCPGIYESSSDKEFFEISYSYEKNPFAHDRWKDNTVCCDICQEYYKKFPMIVDDIKRNDSILKRWKIDRLNWN